MKRGGVGAGLLVTFPRTAEDLDGEEETECVGFGVEERDETGVEEEALVEGSFVGVVTDLLAGTVEEGRVEPVFQGGRDETFFAPRFAVWSAFDFAPSRS
jgi:hypothetical protein